MPDGTILYFEEVRSGWRTLAMVSMRKYPGATDFETIRDRVVPSYAPSDAGDVRIVRAPAKLSQAASDAGRGQAAPDGRSSALGADASGRRRADAVQSVVGAIRQRWKNAPEIVIARSIDDPAITEAVRERGRALESAGTAGRAEGFFYDGKVYLIADMLAGDADVVRVLMHESLGHFGMRETFGPEFGKMLDRMAVLNAGQVRDAATRLGYHFDKQSERRVAAEEVLAYMAQNTPELGWVKRAIAMIRSWARANLPGFGRLKLSDAELIRDFILPARRYVEGGGSGPKGGKAPASPAFSRSDDASEANALGALSENDDLFALPKSGKTTVDGIAADIDPQIKVTPHLAEGLDSYTLTMPDGTEAQMLVREPSPYGPHSYGNVRSDEPAVTVRPGEDAFDMRDVGDVWINVSRLKPGGGGSKVYAIAADFAHNTGRVFIGDPAGVSEMAMRRRAEAMLSSALRWGTTKHLAPHPRQVAGDRTIGVPPLRWIVDDDIGNIRRLIDLNVKALDNAFPASKKIAFDANTGQFIHADTGRPIDRVALRSRIKELRAADDGFARMGGAGGNTVERGAIWRALLREEGGAGASAARRRDGLLARLARLGSNPATTAGVKALFSRSGGLGAALEVGANRAKNIALPAGYRVADLFDGAGKLHWWHSTVGTQYNLAQKSAPFKRVYDRVQAFLNDATFYAAEAAELAPNVLPKLDRMRDIWKPPLSAADTKAVSAPVFEGTLTWARDEHGVARRLEELESELGALELDDKAHKLMKAGHIAPNILRMWQGLPMEQYEKIIEGKFERAFLKPGVVFKPAELTKHFGLDERQIGLYQETRAALDKSLTDLAISEMLHYAGKDGAAVREQVLDAPDSATAAELLRDHLFELAQTDQGRAELLNAAGNKMIEIDDHAKDMMAHGYAPLSRFGRYTLEATLNTGERYFSMFETDRERNRAQRELADAGATDITAGTMSQEAHKLLNGVSPETAALFGEMLGLDDQGSEERKLYTAKDEMTGAAVLDGSGLQFAQALALDAARKNGGNTTAAIGAAVERDNKLKAMANGDPDVLRELRAAVLAEARRPVPTPASRAMTERTVAELKAGVPAQRATPIQAAPSVAAPTVAATTPAALARQGSVPAARRVVPGTGRAQLPWESTTGDW